MPASNEDLKAFQDAINRPDGFNKTLAENGLKVPEKKPYTAGKGHQKHLKPAFTCGCPSGYCQGDKGCPLNG